MKFFLLASFALVCAASAVYKTGKIVISEDGTYVIASPYGWQLLIQGPLGTVGEKYYQFTVTGPYLPDKTWKVSESSIGQEGFILGKIFSEYQGVISVPQWQKLLEKISTVSPQFYQILLSFDQQYIQKYQQPYVQQYYGPYSLQYQQQYGYQYPSYYSQYYGSSSYPLLEKVFGSSYYPGFVPNQEYYGVPRSFLSKYFSQYQQYPDSQYYGLPQQFSYVGEFSEYPYGQQYSSLPYYLPQWFGKYEKTYPYYYNQQPFYSGYQYGLGSYYQKSVPQTELIY